MMKHVRAVFEVAAFPMVAVALFAAGMLAAVAHLVAMPGLYLWEKYQESRPVPGSGPDEG
ncbi:hypothetical protein M2282_004417 [Variovorax boronicumulans]|uniref:hypothetical protein n=1 Tax=Variovorax boronicumulans TaxID=436515 RepID=UPI0024768296|nr:hypothetical protein [Variovorax boronicumulans]MDH6169253.1 hypothetical protein [Variovorax boronicumulans]